MTHVMTLNYDIIGTYLIYEQMCNLTSSFKHLRLCFVNPKKAGGQFDPPVDFPII